MHLETNDKDHEPIQFNEEFRRAKRNVLFWVGVVVLLSIGTASAPTVSDISSAPVLSTNVIEVGSVARNLAFSQNALIFLALVVLIFMAISFVRAESRLGAFLSKFRVAAKLWDAASLAETLVNSLRMWSENAHRANDAVQQYARNVSAAGPVFRHNIMALAREYGENAANAVETITSEFEGQSGPFQTDHVLSIAGAANKPLSEMSRHMELYIEAQFNGFISQEQEVIRKQLEIESNHAQLAQGQEFVSELARQLESFSANLVGGEISWHKWWDVWLVWIAIGLVVTLACTRMMAPEYVTSFIAPAVEEHQSQAKVSEPSQPAQLDRTEPAESSPV